MVDVIGGIDAATGQPNYVLGTDQNHPGYAAIVRNPAVSFPDTAWLNQQSGGMPMPPKDVLGKVPSSPTFYQPVYEGGLELVGVLALAYLMAKGLLFARKRLTAS
jgi:hypothetical protein